MDLRRLRTFVTVAEQGTISKAAVLLHVPSLRCLDKSRNSSRNWAFAFSIVWADALS